MTGDTRGPQVRKGGTSQDGGIRPILRWYQNLSKCDIEAIWESITLSSGPAVWSV